MLTEFNSHAENISDFYNDLLKKGFSYSSTNYSCGWANDILIAVRGNDISVEEVSHINAYSDNPNTTFDMTWENIPENLKVYIKVNEKAFHLWGIRIKDLQCNYEKRKIEMQMVI